MEKGYTVDYEKEALRTKKYLANLQHGRAIKKLKEHLSSFDKPSVEEGASEKVLEARLCREVKKLGGVALKFLPTFANGYPDRLVLMPGGRTFWLELKSGGKKPRALQLLRQRQLQELGFVSEWVDSLDGLNEFLELIQKPITI